MKDIYKLKKNQELEKIRDLENTVCQIKEELIESENKNKEINQQIKVSLEDFNKDISKHIQHLICNEEQNTDDTLNDLEENYI